MARGAWWARVRRWAVVAVVLIAPPAFAGETTQYTYDALGRVVSAIDASGKKVSYTYDSAGNRTRVSNGAEFAEILPTAWSSSSNAGTTGMTTTNGLRDGAYAATSTIVATNVETGAWVKADLGSVQNVNHVAVTPAIEGTTGATIADLNDTAVEYSIDGTIWSTAAAIEGVAPGAAKTVTLGGVALRYLRVHRLASGRVAFGDLQIYSAAAANTPLIANPDSITSTGSAVTFDPRTNDLDQGGYSIAISTVDTPVHGQAVINSGVSITYTPNAGYVGADSFTYTVTDGHNGAASARVSVMAQSATNHVPVAANDNFAIGDRATSSVDGTNALRPLVNDYDADGDVLSITGTSTPAHGTVSVVGSGVINYQPTVGYDGSDSFTYNISDGRGGTATATITVTTANSPPVANPDTVTTSLNQAVKLDPRLNDTDPNGDTITVQSITQPANGTAILNADQTVTYTPNAGFSGGDSLTYTLTDARSATAIGQIIVTVRPNQAPVAVNDGITASASTPVSFDPRANDSDPEGRPLTVVSLTAPSHGTAVINNGGALVTYTMSAGYSGLDAFTYTIADDLGVTATATVAVNGVAMDYLVVAGGGGGGSADGGGGGAGGVLQGTLPTAPGSLAVTVGSGGAGATPTGGNGGNSSLGASLAATGGGGGGRGAYSPYSAQNGGSGGGSGPSPPATGGSGVSGQGFKGGDGTILYVTAGGGGASGPGQGSVSASQAGAGGPGISSSISGSAVNYAAGGGGGGRTDGSTVNVSPGAAGGTSAAAGASYYSDALSAPANRGGGGGGGGYRDDTGSSTQASAGGSGVVIVRYAGSPKATGGTITQVGGYTIHTFTASGTLQVTSTNQAPTAVNDTLTAPSGLSVSLDPRTNDSDPNGDSLKVASVGTPSHGTAVVGLGGNSVIYTSTLGYTGSDSFTYTIGDGAGMTATATVNVTVTGGVQVDVLVVGGGGGGGYDWGGGGGGGAVKVGTFQIASGSYAVTVGAGGPGGASESAPGSDGGATTLGTLITALGGGGASSGGAAASSTGANGGGGSSNYPTGGASSNGGFAGGTSRAGTGAYGAGGGGASAPGNDAMFNSGGSGGGGVVSSISGAALAYGGGAGGSPAGPAGDSSGGAGSGGMGNGYDAPANRGGGGGGGGHWDWMGSTYTYPGGAGGSGVVIIRYLSTAMTATGGTVTTSGAYRIHTFPTSGTFTVP